jgi:beta-lactamase class A
MVMTRYTSTFFATSIVLILMFFFQLSEAQAKHVTRGPKKRILSVQHKRPDVRNRKIIKAPVMVVQQTEIERNIQEFLKSQREKGKLSRDEITGWMVYDLTRDEGLVRINDDHVFQAASMIKPFVALAFFHQVQKGTLHYSPESRRKMEAMIQHSNNDATNWIMRRVGGPLQCENILKSSYSHIFKRTQIKEYIPAGGRTYRNTALPSDYIRFLSALWKKNLPYDAELRRLMALPGRDRLYDGTALPYGTLIYNKTGTTAHLCGDMGIIVPRTQNGQQYPYAFVGIVERHSRASDYGNWMHTRGNVIREVSTLVYLELKRQHRLL